MVRVVVSSVLDLPVDEVWRVLRDFNSHHTWHPAVAESVIEDDLSPDTVGAVRRFRLTDGGELREQLLDLDDRAHRLSYCILDAPLPLHDYVATIQLRPVTDGNGAFWSWSSEFRTPPAQAGEMRDLVANGIYLAGMHALDGWLRRGPAPLTVARAPEKRPAPPPSPPPGTGAQAVVMTRHGGPEVLELRPVTSHDPGPGEVRLRQRYIGVNFIDVYTRTGYFDLVDPPGVPGMEAAGVVEAVGSGVTHLSPGDPAAYACPPPGAYATHRTMAADLVTRLPADLDLAHAAAGLLKGITAAFLLHDVARIAPGDWVVIHAAAGGVGSLLTQWAAALGARVIATVSTAEKADHVRTLGAEAVVLGRGQAFLDEVRHRTGGEGARTVFDAVGRDSIHASLEALAIRGHLVSFGQASGDIGALQIGPLASKSVTLSRPNYGHYVATREMMETHARRLFDALARGIVTIPAPTIFPLDRVREAHSALESGRTMGALVLETP